MDPITRTLALVLAGPALAAPWIWLWADNIDAAMLILSFPLGAAGAVLSLRFYPIRMLTRPRAGTADDIGDTLRSLLTTAAIIAGAVAASALIASVVGIATNTVDAESLAVAPFTLLLASLCLTLGLCAGFVVLLPLYSLGLELTSVLRGQRVDALLVAGSILLLLLALFATAIALAVPGAGGQPTRSGILLALFVCFTVLVPQPDDVVSVAWLWVARGALVVAVAALVWVFAAQPRRRKRVRA